MTSLISTDLQLFNQMWVGNCQESCCRLHRRSSCFSFAVLSGKWCKWELTSGSSSPSHKRSAGLPPQTVSKVKSFLLEPRCWSPDPWRWRRWLIHGRGARRWQQPVFLIHRLIRSEGVCLVIGGQFKPGDGGGGGDAGLTRCILLIFLICSLRRSLSRPQWKRRQVVNDFDLIVSNWRRYLNRALCKAEMTFIFWYAAL